MSFQRILKNTIDFMVAVIGLIILSPLFIFIALLIKLDSKGPIFFRQIRIGKDGKPFSMFKFRTMIEGAEKMGFATPKDDPRITRVGKFLREWTFDELPQLLNVLRGEMSLVGPRPLPAEILKKFPRFQDKRSRVKPGMISLVDIQGRSLVPREKRFELDTWYVENWSLWLDLKILLLVPFVVFSRRGVYEKKINKK